jgi:hypothetical protein
MSQETIISHIQKPKRSSLKNANLLSPLEILNYSKKKRNSVCWKLGSNLNFEKKFMNIQEKNIDEAHDKKFKEARRKSIKNEYLIAKEFLKNDKEIQEIENEDFEEIKENTSKNVKIGKDLEN